MVAVMDPRIHWSAAVMRLRLGRREMMTMVKIQTSPRSSSLSFEGDNVLKIYGPAHVELLRKMGAGLLAARVD